MVTDQSDGDLLGQMGTDAAKWAAEFMRIARAGDIIDGRSDDTEEWMIGWFANAIEAGRAAGRHDWSTLGDDGNSGNFYLDCGVVETP